MDNLPVNRDAKGADLKLQPSEAIRRAVFEGNSSGKYAIIVTDHSKPGEPVAYVNRAFEELTGYKLAEVIGIHPHFLSVANQEQEGVIALESAIKEGRPCSAVLRDYRKDQTPIWYQVCLEPVFSSSHQLTHFFGCMRDVTLLIEAEETEKDREVFMAALAHDLRSPLIGSDRMFALINEGACGVIPPELNNTLKLLSKSNKKALDLVMNLLESYRLRDTVQLMHPEFLNFPALLEEVVEAVQAAQDENAIKIHVTVGEHFPSCYLDRLATVRLLSNLLDNCFKFTPAGGHITVTAEVVNETILLHVIDTGTGISPDDKDMVFKKGKRSGKKNHRFTPGCGLGLYICREIVRAHHGKISFQSQVGVGTDFKVVLPVVPTLNTAEPVEASAVPAL